MKIYHKFLLYQNKLLKPYVRILLGLVEALTYLASLLLIVGVIYEHGFRYRLMKWRKFRSCIRLYGLFFWLM